MACAEVPSPMPLAMGSVMRKSLYSPSDTMAPRMPVTMMTATVMVGTPPNSSVTPMPMADVMDLGSRVTYI